MALAAQEPVQGRGGGTGHGEARDGEDTSGGRHLQHGRPLQQQDLNQVTKPLTVGHHLGEPKKHAGGWEPPLPPLPVAHPQQSTGV